MLINLVFKKCNFFLVEASFARAFADVPTAAFRSKTLELHSLERMKYIVKPEIFVRCTFASPSERVKLRLNGSRQKYVVAAFSVDFYKTLVLFECHR